MERPIHWLGVLAAMLCSTGCRVLCDTHPVAHAAVHIHDNVASRTSFLCWNMRTKCSDDERLNRCSRALELASRSPFELDSLMRRQPAPPVELLHGRWHGINKGAGAAAIGLTQDIKVFCVSASKLTGHNVAVYQVGIDDLSCKGFEPKRSFLTGCEKTMGNFVIQPPCSSCEPLKLDYTVADNRLLDPSRMLVDELVMMDQDLLLGRAYLKVGECTTPIAYFVLMRAPCDNCDVGNAAQLPPEQD